MKHYLFIVCIGIFLGSCSDNKVSEKSVITPNEQYNTGLSGFFDANMKASYLQANFRGRNNEIISNRFPLTLGKIAIENNALVGGSLIFQNGFSASHVEVKYQKLLASKSWLDTSRFRDITFRILMVNPYMLGSPEADADTAKNRIADPNITIVAFLKMRDTAIQVSFPAKFSVGKKVSSITGSFYIDRNKWDIGPKKDTVKNELFFLPNAQFQLYIESNQK
jgi:YceI-like domain